MFTTKYGKKQPKKVKKVKKFAEGGIVDDDPGVLEKVARFLHGGRDLARRKFYNETEGTFMGPEGRKLRGELQGYDAKNISRAVRKDLKEED